MAAGWEAVLTGTGTSVGVPMIGCDCAVCRSDDPRNRRLRSSLLLRRGETRLVVDAGPDFRQQALRYGIDTLAGIILTHEHADHMLGLDDTRLYSLRARQAMPVWGLPECLEVVERVFAYAFAESNSGTFRPQLDLRPVEPDAPFEAAGLTILPVPVEHAGLRVLGVRVGNLAYLPDVKQVPQESMERLRGLDTLILDGLRPRPHPTHLSTSEAVALCQELAPRQAWLTHLTHDLDATTFEATLPPAIRLGYDGLTLPFDPVSDR